MSGDVELKIDQSVIRSIIETKVQSALVEALGNKEAIIQNMVQGWMNTKVSSDGVVNSYQGYNNTPRVEWLANKILTEVTQKAMENHLLSKKEIFVAEMEKFLNSKKGSSQIIKAMQEGLCAALSDKWRIAVNFIPPKE